jgi:uncharacterized metal-binding protein
MPRPRRLLQETTMSDFEEIAEILRTHFRFVKSVCCKLISIDEDGLEILISTETWDCIRRRNGLG